MKIELRFTQPVTLLEALRLTQEIESIEKLEEVSTGIFIATLAEHAQICNITHELFKNTDQMIDITKFPQ